MVDMKKVELNEKSKQICKLNYNNSCDKCPISRECRTNIGPGYENLYKYRTVVNEASNKIDI
jgi:hypothetical protein